MKLIYEIGIALKLLKVIKQLSRLELEECDPEYV